MNIRIEGWADADIPQELVEEFRKTIEDSMWVGVDIFRKANPNLTVFPVKVQANEVIAPCENSYLYYSYLHSWLDGSGLPEPQKEATLDQK